jgi:TonB family protein
MLSLVALAAAVAPVPSNHWLSYLDYPEGALRRSEQGASEFEAVVAPDGKADRCETVWTTGNAEMDRRVCAALMRRARFKPARGEDGLPSWGVYRSITSFWLPDEPGASKYPLKRRPDLRLTVQSLPGGSKPPIFVTVDAAVDEQGALKSCSGVPKDKESKLAAVACTQLRAAWAPAPVKNADGTAIAYVRALEVSFEAPPS